MLKTKSDYHLNQQNYYTIENLPEKIPLLMMRGAVLLPKAQISLPIFDGEHANLVMDCIQNNHLIGLIQPNIPACKIPDFEDFDLFSIGCLTSITEILSDKNSNFIVTLEGICRFKLNSHLQDESLPFPVATVDYEPFVGDLVCESDFSMDRPRLIKALKPYFAQLDIKPNWEEIHRISNQKLLTALSMACPLGPSEKQFILEATSLQEQSEIMTNLIEMASLIGQNESVTYH